MRKYAKGLETFFILILLGLSASVNVEEVLESSGEPEASETSTPYSSVIIDTDSSGDGLDVVGDSGVKVDIVPYISDRDTFLNDTLTDIANNRDSDANNDSFIISDLETTTEQGYVAGTSLAVTDLETTSQETATSVLTTESPSTKTTSILLETTEMKTTTETIATEKETTTVPTTKGTTTTRTSSTRGPTTRRTTVPKVWMTSTKPSIMTTTFSAPDSNLEVQACTFVEEDFMCDLEIDCFGNGIVDCINIEDEAEPSTVESPHETIDTGDYEDEDADLDLDELAKRILAIKSPSLLWKIQSMSTESLETPTVASTASSAGDTSISMTSDISSTSHTDSVENSSNTAAISSYAQTTTDAMSSADVTTIKTEANSPLIDTDMFDSSQTNDSKEMDTTDMALQTQLPTSESISQDSVTKDHSFTEVLPNEEIEMSLETTAEISIDLNKSEDPSARRKRSDDQMNRKKVDPLKKSSSESLHFSRPNKGVNVARSCRIIGNLQCTPLPLTSYCKGRGTCKVPVEKTEKSTSEKKVENWAIIVIAICGTAAALTVSLLIYLVVSSWKKLKVQPQNGVTTLTYVNSTPP